jgi:hypothetical protein
MNKILPGMLFTILLAACKEAYISPVKKVDIGYLVIDGVLNSGSGPARINLSRTSRLDSITSNYVDGAIVRVIGEDNSVYELGSNGNGIYTASDLNLNTGQKYKLYKKTTADKEYASDFVPALYNPAIDSISWTREGGGVQIYVNTHNSQNNTRYYQWDFEETWEFQTPYFHQLKYIIKQLPGEQIYSVGFVDSTTYGPDYSIHTCWQYNNSSDLQLGSSAKLSQDIIHLPLVYIPKDSWELSILYSIRVVQHAWTKAGYDFLQIMKKNTETTGSVFDAQPSQLPGNIHCITDTLEPVIGFFNLSPPTETRIFISNKQVPDWHYREGCYEIKIANTSDEIKRNGIGLMPTIVIDGNIGIFGAAPPYCVDCTLRGFNVKPAYWP